MKILVCVKQVPDTSGKVAVNPDGTLNRASMQTIINPDDMNAVEAALKLKDELGCKVTVVTMGPPPAEGMLRELMAMGADDGYLVSAREFGGSDTYATSQILAAALDTIGLDDDDIVFCGRQAIDGDTAQVGPQIAEKLHLPQITYAADVKKEGDTLTVKRMLEDGYMTIKAQTPCLITCIKELNTPRYMSVSGVFECYSKLVYVRHPVDHPAQCWAVCRTKICNTAILIQRCADLNFFQRTDRFFVLIFRNGKLDCNSSHFRVIVIFQRCFEQGSASFR